jgi:hypothetical protein
MTRRLLLLLVATWAWPTVGFVQEPPKPKANANAEQDSAVLEVVLKDLFSCQRSPLESRNETKKIILFSPEALTSRGAAWAVLDERPHTQLKSLSPAQLDLARKANEDLVRRAKEKETFKDLKLRDERIVVWDKAHAEADEATRKVKRRFDRPQVFRASAPGYSQDRQLAIVRLTFPWSGAMHHGDGTYVLTRKEGEWVVLSRDFRIYL